MKGGKQMSNDVSITTYVVFVGIILAFIFVPIVIVVVLKKKRTTEKGNVVEKKDSGNFLLDRLDRQFNLFKRRTGGTFLSESQQLQLFIQKKIIPDTSLPSTLSLASTQSFVYISGQQYLNSDLFKDHVSRFNKYGITYAAEIITFMAKLNDLLDMLHVRQSDLDTKLDGQVDSALYKQMDKELVCLYKSKMAEFMTLFDPKNSLHFKQRAEVLLKERNFYGEFRGLQGTLQWPNFDPDYVPC